ncbi:MAG TPA: MmgE/PrpD family protein [Steroidobacteraceae bacterium]|nr:MmgE/PrpD family protein [Steroidobacteraceae bacterium]
MSPVVDLAEYAASFAVDSDSAIAVARQCLLESLACGFETISAPQRASLVGPIVPGAVMPGGARVPGTSLELDPAQAAFCLGLMLCRAAGGDDWLAPDHAHIADPVGAILAVADYQARRAAMEGKPPPKVRDVLGAIVKALEIQALLAARDGDRPTEAAAIRLARIAAAAIVTAQLGGTPAQIISTVGYACRDEGIANGADELHASRSGDWVTADAISRTVRHACRVVAAGGSGLPTSLDLEAGRVDRELFGNPRAAAQRLGSVFADRVACSRKPLAAAVLMLRFQAAVDGYFPARQAERIKTLFAARERFDDLPFNEMMAALVTNGKR